MKPNSGQALIFILLLLPILVILAGIVVRSGKTALIHSQIQRHCDQKALDATAAQAKGLEQLGALNIKCRLTIIARRSVDVAIAAALPTHPEAVPELLKARKALVVTQKKLAVAQKLIMTTAIQNSWMILKHQSPHRFRGKISEHFPSIAELRLYVEDEHGFEGEIAAPQVLDFGFEEKQNVNGSITIETERFLKKWDQFKNAQNLSVQCKAQVVMEEIEKPWTVVLHQPDKPSLRPQWL